MTATDNVGFLGLGNLGTAIAHRLTAQGRSLISWNRTRARAETLGVLVADSPRALIEQCDPVFVCLFDSRAVREILQGECGLLAACRNRTIIDLTTNDDREAVAFHQIVAAAGGAYLEAPVLGSVIPASQGTLTILAGGREEVFQKVKPLLEDIGKIIFHFSEPGQATRMKLANNLVLGTFMAGLANAVALAERFGIDRARSLEILAAGAGNSGVLNAKRQKLTNRDYAPHFSAALIHKDLTLLNRLAAELGVPGHLGEATLALFTQTMGNDPHDKDLSIVYEVFAGAVKKK